MLMFTNAGKVATCAALVLLAALSDQSTTAYGATIASNAVAAAADTAPSHHLHRRYEIPFISRLFNLKQKKTTPVDTSVRVAVTAVQLYSAAFGKISEWRDAPTALRLDSPRTRTELHSGVWTKARLHGGNLPKEWPATAHGMAHCLLRGASPDTYAHHLQQYTIKFHETGAELSEELKGTPFARAITLEPTNGALFNYEGRQCFYTTTHVANGPYKLAQAFGSQLVLGLYTILSASRLQHAYHKNHLYWQSIEDVQYRVGYPNGQPDVIELPPRFVFAPMSSAVAYHKARAAIRLLAGKLLAIPAGNEAEQLVRLALSHIYRAPMTLPLHRMVARIVKWAHLPAHQMRTSAPFHSIKRARGNRA